MECARCASIILIRNGFRDRVAVGGSDVLFLFSSALLPLLLVYCTGSKSWRGRRLNYGNGRLATLLVPILRKSKRMSVFLK